MPDQEHVERIAIVGLGGLFPGASDLQTFWNLIAAGRDAGRPVPAERWYLSPEKAFAPWPPQPDRVYSTWGCFLDAPPVDLDGLALDPGLVRRLDPLFHIGLSAARAAWRDARNLAGVDPRRVGVILGNIALPTESTSAICRDILGRTFVEKLIDTAARAARDRGEPHPLADPDAVRRLKSSFPRSSWHPWNRFAAGLPASLIAQGLGLGGIAFTLDAACASSLYALKFAVDELQSHRADAMLAGGMSRPDCQYTQMGFAQLQALSRSGCCAPLSSRADGLVVGEGAGVFVLKRLSDALRDRDTIHGVIAGIGLSNDRGANLLAPHSEGQLRAMRAAYVQAGWVPSDVDLIECHATGTPVGDAVEIASLRQLWQGESARPGQCVLGGVKSNVGHLLTGAGAAGLMKVLLAMRHEVRPATANFQDPATGLADADCPFRVLARSETWARRPAGRSGEIVPRRATVNAFGFGGINAHVLVEEWLPDVSGTAGPRRPESTAGPLTVSGIAAHLGSWESRRQVEQGHFQQAVPERVPARDWGVSETDWWRREQCGIATETAGESSTLAGLRETVLPVGVFRIPPLEIQDMLPQQQLMLQVAAEALRETRENAPDAVAEPNRVGMFVGIELDPNTTNFHFRWAIEQDAAAWAERLGLTFTPDELQAWIEDLKSAAGPPLTANRVMGNLGGIVASRLAREFDVGGPCFTISCGGRSDVIALELAARTVERGELDAALAGGVLLASDPRWQAFPGAVETEPDSANVIPDLAEAVMVHRGPNTRQAYATIHWDTESAGSQSTRERMTLTQQYPLTGAAAVAGNLVRPILEVARELSPLRLPDGDFEFLPLAPPVRTFALRAEDPAPLSLTRGIEDGGGVDCGKRGEDLAFGCGFHEAGGVAGFPVGLFVVEGDTPGERIERLAELRRQVESATTVTQAARHWLQRVPLDPRRARAVVIVASDFRELSAGIDAAEQRVRGMPDESPAWRRRVISTETPLRGRVAFVFPGSGNAFRNMGRELLTCFPDVLRRQRRENAHLADQYAFPTFWTQAFDPANVDHKTMIFGQVALGTAVCDLLARLGIRPSASLGYSLGESAALFGLRAWPGRDEMLRRMRESSLFGSDLVRPFDAARQAWGVAPGTPVRWVSGTVNRPAEAVRDTLTRTRLPRVDLLIINTPQQCVIGGDPAHVERLVEELGATFVPIPSPSTVHCSLLRPVEAAYRALHLMDTVVPRCSADPESPAIDFYSTAWGRMYPLTRESAAEAIVAQAVAPIDFPRVVRRAHADGVRIFIEIGPGSSCTRMIDEILADAPHQARAVLPVTSRPLDAFAEVLALLIAERVPVDLQTLYAGHEPEAARPPVGRSVVTPVGADPFVIPEPPTDWRFQPPHGDWDTQPGPGVTDQAELREPMRSGPDRDTAQATSSCSPLSAGILPGPGGVSPLPVRESATPAPCDVTPLIWDQFQLMTDQRTEAHEAFLRLSARYERLAAEHLAALAGLTVQLATEAPATEMESASLTPAPDEHAARSLAAEHAGQPPAIPEVAPTSLDRDQCLQFAIGRIGEVLGRAFAPIDAHPTRVRLPDEPLMLVDRILSIDGEPLSMTSGRVVTEHDIHPGAWYLDGGRIPTCIAVEAGQADLFLSGWLGIDFETRGLACYRLLDAVVTFHDALPQPGQTIHYDIRLLHFFRQGSTFLFRFEFDATVQGRPLLTMREGCAGFFTDAELASGKGIVHTALDRRPVPGRRPADWRDPVPLAAETYSDEQLIALRRGDLAGAFGAAFAHLPLTRPATIPGGTDPGHRGRMWLLDRILKLDPTGGRFGLGQIVGELDIHPDDWFLTCHFCDDQVMPGTLMYECCLHTLRVYLLRLGWIGETGTVVYEPIPEVRSRLKCRGQVLASTRKVWYEVTLKELGYGTPGPEDGAGQEGTAYCLADALMYADGKPIVEITDMSVRLAGLTRAKVDALWRAQSPSVAGSGVRSAPRYDRRAPLFDTDRITAFAIGNPSDAFGDRYRPFDHERKIARLPGPPFQFLDRVVAIENCEPWVLKAGGPIVAQYDIPPDAWYFAANRQQTMPFAVLLETALQPCGWLAAYLGSALTSDTDLSFRNLGGKAVQYRSVTPESGTLTTQVSMTRVSNSAGMIIQHYDFDLRCEGEPVYQGTTYFGFFSKAALKNQVGIREAQVYQPTPAEAHAGRSGSYPTTAPLPDSEFRMIQSITHLALQGGPFGFGSVIGTMPVDPDAWFFKAHFYQDPVVPGSLGLESFWQLLKVYAVERWSLGPETQFVTPAMDAPAGEAPAAHEWVYRGQVIPQDHLVTVTAVIRHVDERQRCVTGEGFLSVDGRVIYQMKNFVLGVDR